MRWKSPLLMWLYHQLVTIGVFPIVMGIVLQSLMQTGYLRALINGLLFLFDDVQCERRARGEGPIPSLCVISCNVGSCFISSTTKNILIPMASSFLYFALILLLPTFQVAHLNFRLVIKLTACFLKARYNTVGFPRPLGQQLHMMLVFILPITLGAAS